MDFVIEHETSTYMRLRLNRGRFTSHEGKVLKYALSNLKDAAWVRLYPSSGGIAFSYRGGTQNRDSILQKLHAMQFGNVKLFAREIEDTIDEEELARRKLSPEIKDRLRKKVLIETAADLLMPMPLQAGYHLYQLVTLRHL